VFVALILMFPIGLGVYLGLNLLAIHMGIMPILTLIYFGILGWFFGDLYLGDTVKEEFLFDRENGIISHAISTRINQLFRLRTPAQTVAMVNFKQVAILQYSSPEIEPYSNSDHPYSRYCLEMIASHADENLVIECGDEKDFPHLAELGQKLAHFLHLPFHAVSGFL
ncbi:MAG: hypothetical protein Q6K90_03615, partial [Gloeomargarita sp. HHBFW_bins_162]